MKEYLLELLNNSKNLDQFFIFISKEKNAALIREIIDKDLSRAYKRAVDRDPLLIRKIYATSLKEAVSSSRYIASTLMETKKFGGRFFLEEKGIHPAVDFFELFNYVSQIKRMDTVDSRSFNDLTSFYQQKGITTLRVYTLKENSFIGEHTTSYGMKIIIATEDSLKMDFTDEEYAKALNDIRFLCDDNQKELSFNESYVRQTLNSHFKIVEQVKETIENSESALDADIFADFREEQSCYIQEQIKNICKTNSSFIREIDFGKAIDEKKNKDLW